MEYGSESGGAWNVALRVSVCGMWFCEWRCVEYGPVSGGVWNVVLRVEVCGIWL